MKRTNTVLLSAMAMLCFTGCSGQGVSSSPQGVSGNSEDAPHVTSSTTSVSETPKSDILVAYFSATGNTRPIAETIARLTGGDLFEIVPANPYSAADLNYSDSNCRANMEQNDESARPEISESVSGMDNYKVVLIGHPIWWGEEPRIIDTFLDTYELSGKKLANFCTSGGSGISTSASNIRALEPDVEWLGSQRFSTGASESVIKAWIDGLNI